MQILLGKTDMKEVQIKTKALRLVSSSVAETELQVQRFIQDSANQGWTLRSQFERNGHLYCTFAKKERK